MLSIWTSQSPVVWTRIDIHVDSFGRAIETRGFCFFDRDSLPYGITLGVVNLGALAYTIYEAYLARDISMQFSESGYIMKSMIIMLSVSFIGIPVAIIAREDPTASVFVASGLIFVVCMSLLSLIFIPKIVFLRKRREQLLHGTLESRVQISIFSGTHNYSESHSSAVEADEGGRARRQWGSIVIDRRASRLEAANFLQSSAELDDRVTSLEYKRNICDGQDMELAQRVARLAGHAEGPVEPITSSRSFRSLEREHSQSHGISKTIES